MRKRIITAAVVAACLALCAAVWPQNEPAGDTPALPMPAAVIATQPEIPEIAEMEEVISPEEEKAKATLPELGEEADIVPEPSPDQTTPVSEVPVPPEQDATPQQEPEPAPAPDGEPDNMVYMPGFGWIESQGPNHVEYAEDMYENGNKIGIMGQMKSSAVSGQSLVPHCLFYFLFQCVAEDLMDVDQRNDFTEKPLRQFFFVQPGGLRRYIVTGISLCIRSGFANGFLDGEPPTVSAAVQLLSQFPDGALIRLFRTAGTVVVEPDGQLLKGHALLVWLANSKITVYQIQFSGRQHLLHALEEQRSAHEAVVGPGGVTTTPKVKDTLAQRLNLKHGTVFLQQTLGYFGGDRQLLLNGWQ